VQGAGVCVLGSMVRDVEVRDLGCGFKVVISCLGVRG
jgi:hypothetical protein